MASGDTKTEALLNILGHGGSVDGITGSGNTKTQDYLVDAIGRLQGIENEVEELKNNPDVVDIVDTYADLQAYDTQHLSNNDIIRVLADETHSGNSTYYKFNKQAGTWTFIGEISGGSITPVQTTGTSTTDVMSQNATTGMVFADTSARKRVRLGNYSQTTGDWSVAIGSGSNAGSLHGAAAGTQGVAIGYVSAASRGSTAIGAGATAGDANGVEINSTAIGADTNASYKGSVALGVRSATTRAGEVYVGTSYTQYGYNSTNYRVIGGVHDPVDAHDAATKGYVDANAGSLILYAKTSDIVHENQMSFYSDAAFTTQVTIGDIYNAAFNGKDIKIISKYVTEDDFDIRKTYNVYKSYYPKVCTDESIDECGFALYIIDDYGTNTKRAIIFQTFLGPTYYEFGVTIDNIS